MATLIVLFVVAVLGLIVLAILGTRLFAEAADAIEESENEVHVP